LNSQIAGGYITTTTKIWDTKLDTDKKQPRLEQHNTLLKSKNHFAMSTITSNSTKTTVIVSKSNGFVKENL